MPRVNHKKVRELLNEKRSKITDRQFFTSRLLAGHYEDMAAAQTRRFRYNRRVNVDIFWRPRIRLLAETDNSTIRINACHKFITEKRRSRLERYELITGLFAHELGHVLYTDFLCAQSHANFLRSCKWYPSPPVLTSADDKKRESRLWAYARAAPENAEMLAYVAHEIANIIEDGYVEGRMTASFPGTLGHCLELMRKEHTETAPAVDQMMEHEDDADSDWTICDTILQNLLTYSTAGIIKYGSVPLTDERIQAVFSLIPCIDTALVSRSGKDRLDAVNLVLVRLWDYLENYLEVCKKRHADDGRACDLTVTLGQMLGSLSGASAAGSGSTAPVSDPGGTALTLPNAALRSALSAMAGSTGGTEEDAKSEEQPDGFTPEEAPENTDTNAVNVKDAGEPQESKKQVTTATEQGRLPQANTTSVSEPVGGTTTCDEDYKRQMDERAAADIERMLDAMAEKAAAKQLENDRINELNEAAQNISYGDIHAGVNVRVRRIAEVDSELIEQYESIAPALLDISKKLRRSILQQLQDNQRGGKQTGLLFGRTLNAHALHRQDGKMFCKARLPNDIPQLTVTLLLDESGSMSSCDRSTYARATAIIIYDFCEALGIPVTIYGHSTSSNGVDLYSYAEYESFDYDDKYRLMDIGARGGNRDGAALRFVAERLVRRKEEVKLLILVSDGQPADDNYYGTAAEEDLRGIRLEYKRKGVIFAAAAIGDDKQNIERIYGDSFLDITDLTQLPHKLTRLIKRYIKVA